MEESFQNVCIFYKYISYPWWNLNICNFLWHWVSPFNRVTTIRLLLLLRALLLAGHGSPCHILTSPLHHPPQLCFSPFLLTTLSPGLQPSPSLPTRHRLRAPSPRRHVHGSPRRRVPLAARPRAGTGHAAGPGRLSRRQPAAPATCRSPRVPRSGSAGRVRRARLCAKPQGLLRRLAFPIAERVASFGVDCMEGGGSGWPGVPLPRPHCSFPPFSQPFSRAFVLPANWTFWSGSVRPRAQSEGPAPCCLAGLL